MKILIVEDDKALNDGIALSLCGSGSDALALQAYSLAEADKLLGRGTPVDLIILDINLPDGSGLDYCRKIRKESRIPIIFLTANDMETDIVSGLESGADDYITKPFSLAVLRARVNTVLRRRTEEAEALQKRADTANQQNCGDAAKYQDCGNTAEQESREGKEGRAASVQSGSVFRSGAFVFDFENMKFSADGVSAELSKTEQRLLRIFTQNAGRTLTRDTLISRVWDDTEFVEENALSVTVKRLRGKLPGIPIKTVYGIGYILQVDEEK